MTETHKNFEKIVFKFHSSVLNDFAVETMWAEAVDGEKGIYKLDSIPFYGPLIATDDEFYAEFDESEQMLTYRKTTKSSGNSVVLIAIIKKEFNLELILSRFNELNCTTERLNDSYFSMEVLRATDYSNVLPILKEYEKSGSIEFAEPCLSEKHQKDIKSK